jgi:hypothetical protein
VHRYELGELCEMSKDVPNGGKGICETISRTKGSGGLESALHITPNKSHARHMRSGRNSIRLEQFDTRNIWKIESDFHARIRIRISDQLAEAVSDPLSGYPVERFSPSHRRDSEVYKT